MTEYTKPEASSAYLDSEKRRIAQRNELLLARELMWIMKQPGHDRVSFADLDAYCYWIMPKQPKAVKWDLLRHYATNKDKPYFPEYQRNQGPVCKPHHQDYTHRLLTHTVHARYWQQVKNDGLLSGLPRVCFSSGQVVFTGDVYDGMNSMTGIFDRQVLDQVYTLLPYSDHEVEWEKEIRAHEPISMHLAIAWIPTGDFVLELNHWGQLTSVCGKKMMAKMEEQYLQTGTLDALYQM